MHYLVRGYIVGCKNQEKTSRMFGPPEEKEKTSTSGDSGKDRGERSRSQQSITVLDGLAAWLGES